MRTRILTAILVSSAITSLVAQENCNDLFPASITFSPFDSSLIEVHMVNNGQIGWDYPSLVLYNANDSIAWAPAESFAIPGDQVFILHTIDGVLIPTGPFYGRLELWTGFNDSLRCTWYPEPILCPLGGCMVVHPYVMVGTGNAAGLAFTWAVTDDLGQTVANGSMAVPEGSIEAMDSVCLVPGRYHLNVFNPWISGDSVYFSMNGQAWNTGTSPQVELSSGEASTFTLLEACMDQTNSISERPVSSVRSNISNGVLHVRRLDGRALDTVEVLDASGRRIHIQRTTSTTVDVPLGAVAPGLLIVRAYAEGAISTDRVMWAY